MDPFYSLIIQNITIALANSNVTCSSSKKTDFSSASVRSETYVQQFCSTSLLVLPCTEQALRPPYKTLHGARSSMATKATCDVVSYQRYPTLQHAAVTSRYLERLSDLFRVSSLPPEIFQAVQMVLAAKDPRISVCHGKEMRVEFLKE